MSEDMPTTQEQIRILSSKVADLELICAYVIECFVLDDTSDQSRKIAANELRRLAQAHQGEHLSTPDDSAFHKVAEHLGRGAFIHKGFGASGSRGST